MTNRNIVLFTIVIILVLLILLIVNKNKVHKKEENNFKNMVKTEYIDNEGKYLVYDESGKEIYNGTDKAEAEFRERHPDFNPQI